MSKQTQSRIDYGSYEDRSGKTGLIIRWFCALTLLLLFPLHSFAQSHLWKLRPFRATDTDLTGGDHICDLRRDSNGDGTPDRLGDYVNFTGIVIAEPSTYETGGWVFWVREAGCGVMVYGEPECLSTGDVVEVHGQVRVTNGGYFFPVTGLATQGDISIENQGITPRGGSGDVEPEVVAASSFTARPGHYGGRLAVLGPLSTVSHLEDSKGNTWVMMQVEGNPITVYLDADIECFPVTEAGAEFRVTGIVVSMRLPEALGGGEGWCLAPRGPGDIVPEGPATSNDLATWGAIKTLMAGQE
jgi:hypothetical protein